MDVSIHVKVLKETIPDELSLICAKFSHCSPGDNIRQVYFFTQI